MNAVTMRRWAIRSAEADPRFCETLARTLDLSPLIAHILILRGIATEQQGRDFLHGRLSSLPDPFLMKGMEASVDRLVRALEGGEKIVVHGDYDVDGITGTALLTETLRAFGAKVDYHIPLRLRDGYGLSGEALKQAASSGARVVLSVDCGVSAVEEAQVAAELGLDLIVTDHHQPPEALPAAFAIVNPHQPGCSFPFKDLSGVGVAFFLLVALRKAWREKGGFGTLPEPDLRRGLDLVALGTIADMVPLKGVNRLLARVGLSVLGSDARPGIIALRRVAGVEEVTCGAVGFRLAPRLNAAGRLEDAALGVDLLLENDPQRVRETAELLDGFNRERQQIEKEAFRQAVACLEEAEGQDRSAIVLADERWHSGVIGIVASRLVERYHRPTVLISLEAGRGKGSARSISGFHLYRALENCQAFLAGFGGHEFAAGLTIAAGQIDDFAEALEKTAREWLDDEDLLPRLAHDGEVLLEELTLERVEEMATLAPFGVGNPEPAFVASGVRAQQIQVVGENHLRFTARQDGYSQPCIAFGMASRQDELQGELDLLFTPAINNWRGRTTVQLRIRDFRPSEK